MTLIKYTALTLLGLWALINLESCGIGIGEAPKDKPIRRIEYAFPGYQTGLWLGTRTR